MDTHNRGVSWEVAFPHWELVADDAPTNGRNAIALSPPEEQTETIEELSAAFRGAADLALGELYPMVPSLYPIDLPGLDKATTYSRIAGLPATDVVRNISRRHIKRLHRTLALVNMSSAIFGSEQWSGEPVLSAVAQLLLSLDPDEFYTVTKVGFGAREQAPATEFLSQRTDVTDLPGYLEELRARLYEQLQQTAVNDWIAPLLARAGRIDPRDFTASHPQLLQRVPLLNATLVEVLGFLLPDWGLANGLLCPVAMIPEGIDAIDRRVFGFVVAHPGITSDEIAQRTALSISDVERILRAEGEAYRLGERTWTTTTWRRLSVRTPDSIRALLAHERLTLNDLGYDYSGLDEITAAEATSEDQPAPQPAAPTVAPAKKAQRTPPRPNAVFPPPAQRTPSTTPPRPQRPPTPTPVPHTAVTRSALPLQSEDIDVWEKALQERLRGATLAADADLSEREMERLLDVFGAFYRKARSRHTPAQTITKKWGAASLLTMVGCANLEYENNTFWSKYWERLGTEQNSFDENTFRRAITPLLKKFGLDPLDTIPAGRHVERLAVHAGLPAANFPALLEALIMYVAVVAEREARPFDDWITDPSQEVLFAGLGHATRVFITRGGIGAERILTDLVAVVSEAEDNPNADAAWISKRMPDSLPQLVALALTKAFDHSDIGEQVRTTRHISRLHPTLALESDDTVRILLPPPAAYVREPWAITLDAEVRHITPDRFASREGTSIVLDSPVRRAVVAHPSLKAPVEMRLFDPQAPIIAFTTSGKHIPSSQKLPRGEITVLRPNALKAVGDSARPQVTAEFGQPMGWDGWVLENWDLSELHTLRVQSDRSGITDFAVGGRELPHLSVDDDSPEPLPGVSYQGLPVYSARPWITLPAARDAGELPWTVSYRRSGALDWREQGAYHESERYSYELFAEEPELLGAYEVLVTGPDATRFETEFFLAEGLCVEYDDELRIPAGSGLTEVTASIFVEDTELVADVDSLHFDADTSYQVLRVRSGDSLADLKIRPPRLEFRLTPIGAKPAWSDRRMNRHPSDFAQSTLVIRGVAADVSAHLLLVDDAGAILHSTQVPASPRHGAHAMRTDVFTHPATTAQTGQLILRLSYPDDGDWDAPLIRYSTVGTGIRIDLDDDYIHVRNARSTDGLHCHVWQVDKPWKPAVSLPVVDGIAELPTSLRTAGNLRIQPVVEDDWDPVPVQPFPSKNSVLIRRDADFARTEAQALSEFLAGIDPVPHVDARSKEIWSALALLDRELDEGDRQRFKQIAAVIQKDPRWAAESLVEANLGNAEKLAMFVGSGLIFCALRNDHPGGGSLFEVSEPWLDVLFSIADMPAWGYDKRMHEMDRLRDIAGPSLETILVSGSDPLEAIGIDKSTLDLNRTTAELRSFMKPMKIVPAGLIDEAARFEALIALIDQADSLFDESIAALGAHYLDTISAVLKRHQQFYGHIVSRSDQLAGLEPRAFAWANAPWLSAALAYYARMRATGFWNGSIPMALCQAWSVFARTQPRETLIDVVIADAMTHFHALGAQGHFPYRRYDDIDDAVLVASIVSE